MVTAIGCGHRSLQSMDGGGAGSGGTAGSGAAGTSAGGTFGLAGTGGARVNCGARDQSAKRLPPEILLVLDASASMNDNVANMSCGADGCGATSKWAQLITPLSQELAQSQSWVHWGLALFSSDGSCSVGTVPDVAPGADNAQRIGTALARRTSAGGGVANAGHTPMRAALDLATGFLSGQPTANHRYVALVTDGVADCASSGNPTDADTEAALAAARRAHGRGFPVFVVGIATSGVVTNGVEVGAALGQLAMAGGAPRAGDVPYYPVSSAVELASALGSVASLADSCTFQVGPPPTDDGTISAAYIDLFADGKKIPRDPTRINGWDYDDGANLDVVTVYGEPCRAIREGSTQAVTVTYRCIWP
jgi:hypothetical protein